jgi:hypothetical protein
MHSSRSEAPSQLNPRLQKAHAMMTMTKRIVLALAAAVAALLIAPQARASDLSYEQLSKVASPAPSATAPCSCAMSSARK